MLMLVIRKIIENQCYKATTGRVFFMCGGLYQ